MRKSRRQSVSQEFRILSHSPLDTFKFGQYLAEQLSPGDIVALYGSLGTGKTVLVKGVCQGLGVQEEVTSPSFTIMNLYSGRWPVYHFDFYRLEGGADWEELGLDEFLYGEGVSFIEWADRLADSLPDHTIEIFIRRQHPASKDTENLRQLVIKNLSEAGEFLLEFDRVK